ncbi:hypothetical protein [Hymenobacter terrenus]|uniref:hypothetical protein n=1 Tax=Hymenobacter terrenus TaxID=1629124 RepID=UPI0006195E8C|nr:hypothetical protein [Hymenobacter terrenus]
MSLVVNNIISGALSNTSPAQTVASLSATVTGGPPLSNFTIQTLPNTTSGILYLGGSPVIPGQIIPSGQANQLMFAPVAGYVGSAVFTYTATDNSGAGSNNTATFTIPVDNRPLPVELVSFEATAVDSRDAQLTWRTASEKNNDHFDVKITTISTWSAASMAKPLPR